MFRTESDMVAGVTRWLRASRLDVRPEFVTPWGACDLVGIEFDCDRIAHRLRLRQRKSITSITRAALLLKVPDAETLESISLRRLANALDPSVPKARVSAEVTRLLMDRFLIETPQGGFQKLNGWMPLQKRLVAVELKLTRIDEAFQQAHRNLGFADESFVAFPMPVAQRVAKNKKRWTRYFESGVGVVGVTTRSCRILVDAVPAHSNPDPAIQLYCVEKFWRDRYKATKDS